MTTTAALLWCCEHELLCKGGSYDCLTRRFFVWKIYKQAAATGHSRHGFLQCHGSTLPPCPRMLKLPQEPRPCSVDMVPSNRSTAVSILQSPVMLQFLPFLTFQLMTEASVPKTVAPSTRATDLEQDADFSGCCVCRQVSVLFLREVPCVRLSTFDCYVLQAPLSPTACGCESWAP
jgi:hypothetical protein